MSVEEAMSRLVKESGAKFLQVEKCFLETQFIFFEGSGFRGVHSSFWRVSNTLILYLVFTLAVINT
jgi:hypothetical protein